MASLEEYFGSFTSTIFRFEGLASYAVPDEIPLLEAYRQRRQTPPPPRGEWAEWLESLRKWTASGKTIRRVRMLPQRSSTYVNCELDWGYPLNVQAGEDIRTIPEAVLLKITAQMPPDFWLFDNQFVGVMKYSSEGKWLGADMLKSGEDRYIRIAAALWDAATPLEPGVSARQQRTEL